MSGDGQPTSVSVPILACGVCLFSVLVGLAALKLWKDPGEEGAKPQVSEVVRQKQRPSLYCVFSDFTHASAVVGFDFAVAFPANGPPRFSERAEAIRNDPAVNFDRNSRPDWRFGLDEDGTQTITSPDGATRLLLYGLKLGVGDTIWTEAGIRSNTFRNLDGKCLQSHFDDVENEDVMTTPHP